MNEDLKLPPRELRIEDLWGSFPQVTSAPTWTPKTFRDSFAYYLTGGVYRFYFYIPNDNSWRYVTLT